MRSSFTLRWESEWVQSELSLTVYFSLSDMWQAPAGQVAGVTNVHAFISEPYTIFTLHSHTHTTIDSITWKKTESETSQKHCSIIRVISHVVSGSAWCSYANTVYTEYSCIPVTSRSVLSKCCQAKHVWTNVWRIKRSGIHAISRGNVTMVINVCCLLGGQDSLVTVL